MHTANEIATTRAKSIYSFPKLQTAKNSRGWVQFPRFFDRNDEEIYFFETNLRDGVVEKLYENVEKLYEKRPKKNRKTVNTFGPRCICGYCNADEGRCHQSGPGHSAS